MSEHYQPRRGGEDSKRTSKAGLAVIGVLFLVEAAFCVFLLTTRLLPVKFLLLAAAILLVLLGVVALLVFRPEKKGRFAVGLVLAVVTALLLAVGSYYIAKGVDTLSNITETKREVAHIGVYVLDTSEAQTINDVADGKLGILAELDRVTVERSLELLEAELAREVSCVEYDGLAALITALLDGHVPAIVFNDAYLGVLEEMEGYEGVSGRLRELKQVEVVVEEPVQTDEPEEQEQEETVASDWLDAPDHVFTMYISGIDSRHGLTAKSRSDVNILAMVNTETRQVLLVSTPRDYYVPHPYSNGRPDKLTHAGIYGVSSSMGALEMLYRVELDYYFRVNFEGFKDIINSLGGVTVHSDVAFSVGSHSYKKGENYMDGDAALTFARERYSFASGDRQRGKNQMAVIKGVINKALSPDILANYASLMEAVEGSFETSMSYDSIASLVRRQLDQGGGWNIVSYSVDGGNAKQTTFTSSSKVYVMIPDQTTIDTARSLMEQLIAGEVLSAS